MAGTARFVRAQDGSGAPLLRIGAGQAASWVRNFNPLVPDSLFPTQYAIHEPMLVFSTATGKTTPWLATGWGFSDDGKRLSFTLRDGVKWSDGQPFTARDVAFTLNLLKKNPGLSGSGGIRGVMDTMTGAAATDDRTCTVDFSRAFTPALYAIGQQSIVPEHHLEGRRRPGDPCQRKPGRHRPLHPGHGVQAAILGAAPQPELLAGGQAGDRGAGLPVLRLERRRHAGR